MILVVFLEMVALVLMVTAQEGNEEFNAREHKSNSLAKSLRHQLMIDNYDYSYNTNSTEKEIASNRRKAKKTRKNFYVSDLAIYEKDDGDMNFHSKTNDSKKNNKKNVEHDVSKKDLLYYIDFENKATERSVSIETTARYKLLKLKSQYRRIGQARLIQEENKEGVAIVNLDKGPFPELRLPNSRRQYMHDHGEAMTEEEEVPPPAVNTSDPEAAPDEVENVKETELVGVSTTSKY